MSLITIILFGMVVGGALFVWVLLVPRSVKDWISTQRLRLLAFVGGVAVVVLLWLLWPSMQGWWHTPPAKKPAGPKPEEDLISSPSERWWETDFLSYWIDPEIGRWWPVLLVLVIALVLLAGANQMRAKSLLQGAVVSLILVGTIWVLWHMPVVRGAFGYCHHRDIACRQAVEDKQKRDREIRIAAAEDRVQAELNRKRLEAPPDSVCTSLWQDFKVTPTEKVFNKGAGCRVHLRHPGKCYNARRAPILQDNTVYTYCSEGPHTLVKTVSGLETIWSTDGTTFDIQIMKLPDPNKVPPPPTVLGGITKALVGVSVD